MREGVRRGEKVREGVGRWEGERGRGKAWLARQRREIDAARLVLAAQEDAPRGDEVRVRVSKRAKHTNMK